MEVIITGARAMIGIVVLFEFRSTKAILQSFIIKKFKLLLNPDEIKYNHIAFYLCDK
jgi:hypothetical protein